MKSGNVLLIIIERTGFITESERACFHEEYVFFCKGPSPWQLTVMWFTALMGTSAKMHPCPKVSGEGQGGPTAAPLALLWQQDPAGAGVPTVVWGPRANSPLQKTRAFYLGLLSGEHKEQSSNKDTGLTEGPEPSWTVSWV